MGSFKSLPISLAVCPCRTPRRRFVSFLRCMYTSLVLVGRHRIHGFFLFLKVLMSYDTRVSLKTSQHLTIHTEINIEKDSDLNSSLHNLPSSSPPCIDDVISVYLSVPSKPLSKATILSLTLFSILLYIITIIAPTLSFSALHRRRLQRHFESMRVGQCA